MKYLSVGSVCQWFIYYSGRESYIILSISQLLTAEQKVNFSIFIIVILYHNDVCGINVSKYLQVAWDYVYYYQLIYLTTIQTWNSDVHNFLSQVSWVQLIKD